MNAKSFLYRVAQSIKDKKNIDFEDTLIVLPNKRAKNFLLKYVYNENKPIFLFDIVSIDDLVKNNVYDKIITDKLPLIYILYKSYCKIYYSHNPLAEGEQKESFTDFYTWGKTLLNDFDEIDKHLVEAKVFFRNMEDYKNLKAEPGEYLTREQKEILKRFFTIEFNTEETVIKNFVKIWNCLYEIYEDFNSCLLRQNISYSGQMYKDFAQRLENKEISLKYKRIVIAGFGVLNNVEKKIFQILKTDYNTEFYWDYDKYYADNYENEAGIFIRENLKQFPMPEDFQQLDFDRITTNNEQKLKIVESSYTSFSLTYIKQWLNEIDYKNRNPNDIAIVLHDESIIPMVLKSLPEDVYVNVTMGYPFKQTLLYNIITDYVNKWVNQGFTPEVIDKDIRFLAQQILQKRDEGILWQLDVLKSINETLIEFAKTLDYYDKGDISSEIISDTVKKYLHKESADLVSDATNGIQIMGLLETRCLDFKYVLMLSCSDDNLPKIAINSSFIPFSFKEAYNLMSVKRKTGLFAYYFYRLFHTTDRMDFVYNTASEEKIQEISRFLRQIKIEMSAYKPIEEITIAGDCLYSPRKTKCAFDITECEFLGSQGGTLSASALNKLIDCEKKFYLSSIRKISKDIKIEDYRAIAFGNMFHLIASQYYEKRQTDKETKDGDLIRGIMKSAFANPYEEQTREYQSRQKDIGALDEFHHKMLEKYLSDLIEADKRQNNKQLASEREFSYRLEVDGHIVNFKSRLDRIDQDNEKNYRIVDYKTGKKPKDLKIKDIVAVFNEDYENRKNRKLEYTYVFEVLFYCWLVYNQPPNKNQVPYKPILLYLSDMENGDILLDKEPLIYNREINETFEKELNRLISSLISKDKEDFYKETSDINTCKNCDFALLCNKSMSEETE